jgi:hypothetical protein
MYGRCENNLANPWYKEHFSLPAKYIDVVRRAGGIPLWLFDELVQEAARYRATRGAR